MLHSRTSQTNKLLLYLSLSVCLGVLIGTQITGLDTEKTFFNANFNKLRKIISYIEEDYVDEVAEDEEVHQQERREEGDAHEEEEQTRRRAQR